MAWTDEQIASALKTVVCYWSIDPARGLLCRAFMLTPDGERWHKEYVPSPVALDRQRARDFRPFERDIVGMFADALKNPETVERT